MKLGDSFIMVGIVTVFLSSLFGAVTIGNDYLQFLAIGGCSAGAVLTGIGWLDNWVNKNFSITIKKKVSP